MFVVLDPWISYSGLLADCGDDLKAHSHLEATKTHLHNHFCANYNQTPSVPIVSIASTSTTNSSLQKVDFTSHYWNLPQAYMDEVQEYFKLPWKNFNTCNPLQWWAGCHSQFPNLSQFARDVLSIPGQFNACFLTPFVCLFTLVHSVGSAVAVKQIFSGGCNTIFLHHASLNSDTTCTLMLVKQQLCLAQTAVQDIPGD